MALVLKSKILSPAPGVDPEPAVEEEVEGAPPPPEGAAVVDEEGEEEEEERRDVNILNGPFLLILVVVNLRSSITPPP